MTSRYLPYASRPHRFAGQFLSDVLVIGWIVVWVMVGVFVHAAIDTIADVGRQVQSGATGISESLNSAGDSVDNVPLVGDKLAAPLDAASRAALELSDAGSTLTTTATWLAWLLALAVAAAPILAVGGPWLYLRARFFRRKRLALSLASSPAGVELLALRALTNRPVRRLVAISPDPVGGWRAQDPATMSGLVSLELRAAGLRA
ncbi:hypothetical protein [Mycolicibacterium brumae]|uniref:Transmembrane protein n=1 Tax=Mycolicibacterium brumae TaxID=85968 RepID=A0A2G5P5I8_9MYCO|nr:hypothetical protein [Mycolicibacterium brumae]MCV7191335.1 hypothetical protein [Mycolicibacterium brumae]PIB73380.1 hypothetical protein CQY22_016890 [Mycolicibacterium brumae]RWA18179.1 hypothetical protein MBRU_17720 [Mycolicibacterium brumae DSM 44177]UWW07409.1 hypothetical protein L2Z93_000417 [Mycolicibacterium brumae]